MMINPSIEQLTKNKKGMNRYMLVIACAKSAHMITKEYLDQRAVAEQKITNKETDKPLINLIDRDLLDKKPVENAVLRLKAGNYYHIYDSNGNLLD